MAKYKFILADLQNDFLIENLCSLKNSGKNNENLYKIFVDYFQDLINDKRADIKPHQLEKFLLTQTAYINTFEGFIKWVEGSNIEMKNFFR